MNSKENKVFIYSISGFGGLWGMLCVGLFAQRDRLEGLSRYDGLLHGGGFYLLGVQAGACLCLAAWASAITFMLIWVRITNCFRQFPGRKSCSIPLCSQQYTISKSEALISLLCPAQGINRLLPFRMDAYEELLGADYTEHNVRHPGVGVTRAVSVIRRRDSEVDLGLILVGKNKGERRKDLIGGNSIKSSFASGHMDYLEKVYAARLNRVLRERGGAGNKIGAAVAAEAQSYF